MDEMYQISQNISEEEDEDDIEEEQDPHGTPEKEILWAAVHGHIDLVKDLVESNPDLVKVQDHDGYTPLHRACYENHMEIAKLLLRNGANISSQTNELWQPLHSASKWHSNQCIVLLLDWGADINALTRGGFTPLHLAASSPNSFDSLVILLNHPLVDTSIKCNNGETAFKIARRRGPFCKLFAIASPSIDVI